MFKMFIMWGTSGDDQQSLLAPQMDITTLEDVHQLEENNWVKPGNI